MGSFSIWHWLIVLAIILLVFGTKKLRNMGPDLGSAIREFKKALGGDENKDANADKDAAGSTLHNDSVDPETDQARKRETRDDTD